MFCSCRKWSFAGRLPHRFVTQRAHHHAHDFRLIQPASETVTSHIDSVRFLPGISRNEGGVCGRVEPCCHRVASIFNPRPSPLAPFFGPSRKPFSASNAQKERETIPSVRRNRQVRRLVHAVPRCVDIQKEDVYCCCRRLAVGCGYREEYPSRPRMMLHFSGCFRLFFCRH